MYSMFKEVHPPTGVELAVVCNFLNSYEENLVISTANELQVYRMNHNIGNKSNDTELRKEPEKSIKSKLECLLTFKLFEKVVSIQPIKIENNTDFLLLCFQEAKLSLVQYDREMHDLKTTTLHNYEFDYLKDGREQNVSYLPIARCDPESRCAAALLYGNRMAVFPFFKNETGISISYSYIIDLRKLNEKVTHVVDFQFLHGFCEPTVAMLYEPLPTWSGRIAIKKDSFSMVAISLNLEQQVNPSIWSMDEAKAFQKKGCKPASDYDRCLKRIEDALLSWHMSDKQHSPNEVVLRFAYYKFSLTRHCISGTSAYTGTDKDSELKTVAPKSPKIGDISLDQQKEMPKAWLDMLDGSNMFPRPDAHHFHKCFGLKEFIVIATCGNKDIPPNLTDMLLSIFSFVALKCKCQLPLFVKCGEKRYNPPRLNPGILQCPGLRTSFRFWNGLFTRLFRDNGLNLDLVFKKFEYKMYSFRSKIQKYVSQVGAKVSMKFTYHINMNNLKDFPFRMRHSVYDRPSAIDLRECERLWYDKNESPNVEFYLNATWSDQLYSEVIIREADRSRSFNALDAPKWSVQVNMADTSEVPLGDCLKRFLSLCTSTQTGSLLSNPEIFSMLKYRRIYKQTEEVNASPIRQGSMEPKVISKLTLKPEESTIPLESLNVILDFLFHDAKLQSSQHSNGSNPSTTTTVEDYVEDKFFLSYKELSKYFKSTQPSSLLSRLAICLCVVNKYHGGLGAVKQLWAEFVLELKYYLEINCEIEGLEPVEPKLDYSELLQKLQMLNSCIKEKKARVASSPITDSSTTIKINTLNFNEEFTDISELPLEKSIGLSEVRSGVGLSRSAPNLRIQMLFDRILAKDAFYAANPGCAIGDFVRWCSDEYWMEELVTDEGKDKITNKNHQDHLNQWIQISDDVSLVFHKSNRQRRLPENDDAAKAVLHWLALVEPSDLVLKLMPTLIHSAVTTLLQQPVCQLVCLQEYLLQFRNKLIGQFLNEGPQCTSSGVKMLEEHVDCLALFEQKMARAQYLLKKLRYVDPSYVVSDTELEKYVSDLVEFKEVPIKTLKGELPSNTSFGKLIYKFFCDHKKTKKTKSGTEVAKVKPQFKEYILTMDYSETTGSGLRVQCNLYPSHFKIAAAYTDHLLQFTNRKYSPT